MEDTENKEKIVCFLAELFDLCEKYSIAISGCGCCDSPYLLVDCKSNEVNDSIVHFVDTEKNILFNKKMTTAYNLIEAKGEEARNRCIYGYLSELGIIKKKELKICSEKDLSK